MRLFKFSFFLFAILVTFSCKTDRNESDAESSITSESLREHIEILASDNFMGRAPGTPGEQKTVDYIVSQFKKYGLEPGMPDGSYTQNVPLLSQTTNPGARLSFTENGRILLQPTYHTNFMAWPAQDQEIVHITEAELVYVGYGIQAPEEGWDDFKDSDLDGKVLIFKNFNPVTHPDLFDGGSRLYYGRWSYKFEKAAEMGALGALIIHTDNTAGYPWSVVANSWGTEQFNLQSGYEHDTEFEGWLSHSVSRELFSSAGLNLDEMLEEAENPAFEPVPFGDVRLSVQLEASYHMLEGQNVVAKLRGSHRRMRDEAVVFSAHHDHLGTGEPVNGDSIFNGAWDNASGVSAMLEIARAFSNESRSLRRSIYFVSVTAEEAGLLGSQYFVENSPVSAGKMAANINLDAINIFGATHDIVAIGYGRSDIDDILEDEARKLNRIVVPDLSPEQGYFYRSDHFSFARAGVPALYPNSGREFIDKPENYTVQVEKYISEIYHTVNDKIHYWWDLSGAVRDTQLIYRVARRMVNENEMRRWTPGDEFEAAREASF